MSKKQQQKPTAPAKSTQGPSGGAPAAHPAPPPPPPPEEPVADGEGAPLSPTLAAVVTVFQLVAMGVAIYLLRAFLQKTYGEESFESACNFSETFNCDKINTSTYGKIAGVPITVFAIPSYFAFISLAWLATKATGAGRAALRLLTVGSGGAVLYGLFLLYVMAAIEKTFCVFCLTMDTMALLTFAVAFVRHRALSPGSFDFVRPLGTAFGIGLLSFGVAFAAQNAVRRQLVDEAVTALDAGGPAAPLPASTGQARKISENLYEIPVAPDDPSVGPKDAKVTIVEFADFQCGYCKKLFYSLTPLKQAYKDKVRFVFKNYPMNKACNPDLKNDRHKYACDAAEAAQCAHRQGKFWEMHDILFKNQHKLEGEDLRWYAQQVGLDIGAFDQCVAQSDAMNRVKEDIAVGKQIQIEGTPRTFVNGRMFKGAIATEVLEKLIQKELGAAGPAIAQAPAAQKAGVDPATASPQVELQVGGKTVWMDRFEASVDGGGRALSLAGVKPANASWYEAKKSCEAAGKRLCTEEEWVTACQGVQAKDDNGDGAFADDYVEGNQYPYADWYDAGMCRDAEDKTTGSPGATGSMRRCQTDAGVFDLSGNVQEWVGGSEPWAVLLGGDYGTADHADCFRRNDTFGPGHKTTGIGYRCCSDAATDNASAAAVEKAAPATMIGQKVPKVEGELLSGGSADLQKWKGKVIYLTFFASWCTPCRKEMPELERLQAEYGSRGLQVISVGVDTDAEKARAFAEKTGVTYPVLLDPTATSLGRFDVKSMPTTYIIGKDGVIKHKQVGFGENTLTEVKAVIEGLL